MIKEMPETKKDTNKEIINSSLKYISDLLNDIKSVDSEFECEEEKLTKELFKAADEMEYSKKNFERQNIIGIKCKLIVEKINKIENENKELQIVCKMNRQELSYYRDTIKEIYEVFMQDFPKLHITHEKKLKKAIGI